MKKAYLAIAVFLGIMLMSGSAYGFAFSYYPGFGSSVFDENNNTSPINYPGIGYYPAPGQYGTGGEGFDDEGLFLAFEDGSLYGALANSYGDAAYSIPEYYDRYYPTGNLFFGFNGAYDQFAIDLADGKLYKVNAWEGILDLPGSYYNNLTIRNQAGAFRITDGVLIEQLADWKETFLPDYEPNPLFPSADRDTYVYEWRIDMSSLAAYLGEQATTATFHHTLACGNDLIERDVAIPEPATLILFGSGLLGFGLYRRRRK